MRLLEKIYQNRRDFAGIYECESCGKKLERFGCYDDNYFHTKVMPDEKCQSCGKSTNDLGLTPQKVVTKYAEHEVV